MRREKFFIVIRSFWPASAVIGEALLQLAEKAAQTRIVTVVSQDRGDIKKRAKEMGRGAGVQFFSIKPLIFANKNIVFRILDAVLFMWWAVTILLWQRPKVIYIASDPPVLVPFVVMLYSRIFGARYIYHLQDIHPEATNVVIPVNPVAFKFFKTLDSITMRRAKALITLTEAMADVIRDRSHTKAPIHLLPNPAAPFDGVIPEIKKSGFVFCGTMGRMQRVPLLIEAVARYCDAGGKLPFVFAGGGIHADLVVRLSRRYNNNVQYLGTLGAAAAAQLSATYQWAILPIEDGVTNFAFPSRTSTYARAGAYIMAICDKSTSVAEWVQLHKLGVVVEPQLETLVGFFFSVERNEIDLMQFNFDREELFRSLTINSHVDQLVKICLSTR